MIATEFLEVAGVVVALYVSELVVYLPPGRAALIVLGRRVRLLRGLGLVSPFPWSRRYDLDDFHLQFGVKSVIAYAPHRIDSRKPLGYAHALVHYDGIVIVDVRDKDVRTNAKVLVVAPSASAALRAKRELDDVRRAPETARLGVIRKLIAHALDPSGVATIDTQDRKAVYALAVATTLHMLCVIAVTSAFVLNQVDRWRYLAGALATTWLYAVFRFYRTHRTLRPNARAERNLRTFMYCLSPVAVIKAVDYVTKERLAELHWLAALRQLGTHKQAQDALRATKRELDHPGDRTWIADEPSAKAAQSEFRSMVSEALAPLVESSNVPEASGDDGIVVRCPACGAGYTRLVEKCFDCGAAIAPTSA